MKISKNSWHYKLNRFWWPVSRPQSLCTYFWSTVAALVVTVGAVVSTIFVAFCTLFAAGAMGYFMVTFEFPRINTVSVWQLVFLYSWAGVGLFALICYITTQIADWHTTRKHEKYIRDLKAFVEGKPEKEPNVFWAYLKAKKEKVCPFIEYTDE